MLYFPKSEYEKRVANLQKSMAQRDVSLLMSICPENIFYLTGHHSPGYYMHMVALIPVTGTPYLLVRQGELGNAWTYSWLPRENVHFYDDTDDPVHKTLTLVSSLVPTGARLGMEMDGWFLSPLRYEVIKATFGSRLVDCSKMVEALRMIKSPLEVEKIRLACDDASNAMKAAYARLENGVNENQLASAILQRLVEDGSDYLSMEPFVASGPRAASMHSPWSGRVVVNGEVVLLEIGGCRHRYHGALMRTLYLGKPREEAVRWSKICIEALNAAISTIKPGATSGEVDQACRGVIEEAGLYEYFRKRTGYSIGIAFSPDWGEGHFLGLQRSDPTVLKPGMTFHMPPACRRYGDLGVGFSETVLVTNDGCEVLTSFPQEFLGK